MAGGKLEVQIGADITEFENKIKEVELDIRELSKVKLERLKVGLDTTEINAQIKDAKQNLNSLKTTVKDTGAQIGGQFTKQVGNGGNTLMQFSRIAQDAPFGIIGIGNNITATTEAFTYLKQSTGSTGGALKALASSIAGTGGILLGVSLLTTGLTLLSQSGLTVGDVIDKITGKFDAFGSELNKIAVDSAKNSAQEIAGVNALVSVAQDDIKSRKDRLLAVEELQNKYPAYFGNLNTEKILNGDLTGVTKELTKAIIARAEATALADKIGELASKKLDLEIKREKALLKLKQAQTLENNKVNVTGGTFGATGLSTEGRLATATATVLDLDKQILEVKNQQDKLAGRLNQKTSDSIKLLEKKSTLEKTKVVKTFETPTVSQANTGIEQQVIVIKPFDTSLIKSSVEEIKAITANGLVTLQEALYLFSTSVNELVSESIQPALESLGSSIGEAIASGGNVLANIGQSLLQSLGGFISELGKRLITYGLLLAGFGKAQKAFESGDATVKIGAGIAMVALGVAAVAAGKAVSTLGSSGGNRGGASTSSGSGANNQSFSSGSFQSASGGGTVVFEIAGQKLIGVLNNTLGANKRLGGSIGLG